LLLLIVDLERLVTRKLRTRTSSKVHYGRSLVSPQGFAQDTLLERLLLVSSSARENNTFTWVHKLQPWVECGYVVLVHQGVSRNLFGAGGPKVVKSDVPRVT
jgi:hypothetical protein